MRMTSYSLLFTTLISEKMIIFLILSVNERTLFSVNLFSFTDNQAFVSPDYGVKAATGGLGDLLDAFEGRLVAYPLCQRDDGLLEAVGPHIEPHLMCEVEASGAI